MSSPGLWINSCQQQTCILALYRKPFNIELEDFLFFVVSGIMRIILTILRFSEVRLLMEHQAFMHTHAFILAGVQPLGEEFCFTTVTSSIYNRQTHPAWDGDLLCSIAVFTKGTGLLDLNGVSLALEQGSALQLRPGHHFSCRTPGQGEGWLIRFWICRLGEALPIAGGFPLLPYHQEIAAGFMAALYPVVQRLTRKTEDNDELGAMRKQAALLELLALLVESQERRHEPTSIAEAVEKAAAYAREHYTDSLTVEQLASIAGVGRWQFSEQFRALTGEKPLDYIHTLRMNRAKELLLLTDEPLREIALSVGFRDECYFSRRFSRMYGCSPKAYARTHTPPPIKKRDSKKRAPLAAASPSAPSRLVVCGSILGDVLSLGIKPLAAALAIMGKQVVYRHRLDGILDVEAADMAKTIAALHPDLILREAMDAGWVDSLPPAASIVSFRRTENPAVRLRAIAALLGQDRQAEDWISGHEKAAQAMWSSLRSRMRAGETATVVVLINGRLFAMSNQGLAATLYHPRGFRPSEGAQELTSAGLRFRHIAPDQLSAYDADRLFLLVSGNGRQDLDEAGSPWTENPLWRRLHAFRSGTIHLAPAKWNYDDSLTRQSLLPVLPQILASRL